MMKIEFTAFYKKFVESIDCTREENFGLSRSTEICTRRVFEAVDEALGIHMDGKESLWEGKSSEFICDYVARNKKSYEVLFALESEWGKKASRPESIKLIKQDFLKLLNINSSYKVMVFGYVDSENEVNILKCLKEILLNRTISTNDTYWLISAPWNDEMYSETLKRYEWINNDWYLR